MAFECSSQCFSPKSLNCKILQKRGPAAPPLNLCMGNNRISPSCIKSSLGVVSFFGGEGGGLDFFWRGEVGKFVCCRKIFPHC